jgi:PAS domain S-box-containing protein
MHDPSKTYQGLIEENSVLKQKIRELKQSEVKYKQADEELRNSEERYRKITKCSPDLIWTMDLSGQFTYVNEAVERTHGWTVDEWLKLNTRDVVSPQQFAKNAALIEKEFMKATDPQYDRNTIFSYESEEVRKDGSIFWAEINATSLWSEDGMPTGIIGITRDITERKRTEKIIQENQEHLRGITENLPGVIFQFCAKDNGEYRISYVSEHLTEFLGITANIDTLDLDGLFPLLLSQIYEEDRNRFLESMKTAIENRNSWNFEGRIFVITTGKLIWFQGLATPTFYENQPVFDGILLDITERKLAEEKSQKSEDKFHKIFMTSPHCIAITQLKDGLMMDVNQGFEDIVGWKREQVIGTKSSEPPMNFWLNKSDRRLMVAELKAGRDIHNREFEFRKNDGSLRSGIYSARPIYFDNNECLIFILQDITDNKLMEAELRSTLESLRKAVGTTIQVLVSASESRDPYTAGHQKKSADVAIAIAMEMGLAQDKIEGIRMAGSIHDIGKLSVPAEILSKPTKLTKIEFSLIKEHARIGYEMLKDVESPWPLAEIVHQHHERMNGSGYPRNLKGDEILMESRILAVADVVEAMASHRPYRPTLGIEAALEEIEKNKGILYDNVVAAACLKIFREKSYKLP